jgi:hypothetical protein
MKRLSRPSGGKVRYWIPACAGMTLEICAGLQRLQLDSRLRGNDGERGSTACA